MTDTFQPGDHVTFELTESEATELSAGRSAIYVLKNKIKVHTRPGEATPQPTQTITTGNGPCPYCGVVVAALPGEGMKGADRLAEWIFCHHAEYIGGVVDYRNTDHFMAAVAQKIDEWADARRGGPDWKEKIIILLDLIRRQGWGPTTEYNGEYFYEDIFPLLDVANFAEISVKAAEYREKRTPKPADIK